MKRQQEKFKVLYVVNNLGKYGGVPRILCNKIDAWIDEFNYDVTVVALNQGEKPIAFPVKNSFGFIDLKLRKHDARRFSVRYIFKYIFLIRKAIRKESPGIVITTLTGVPSLILPFIEPTTKKILEIHGSGAFYVSPSWKYKWTFLNRYYKVIVLNEDEKQYYKLSNLAVIPNFTPLSDSIEPCYENRKNRIVAAGEIHPDKQHHHLIQAWKIVYNKYPDWNVEIYGDGNKYLLESFQAYIEEHDIERIQFKPATGELEDILSSSSFLCLTSRTESFSMVLIECKKCMLPAISYDSPNGPRHIIKDDGILVEHNNIEKLAEEIGRLIENDALRIELARNAYRNRTTFSSSEIMKEWNKLVAPRYVSE